MYTLKNNDSTNAINVTNTSLYSVNPYSFCYSESDFKTLTDNETISFSSQHPLFTGVTFLTNTLEDAYAKNRARMRMVIVQYIEAIRKQVVDHLVKCKIR